jgi:hypothetical protein
LLVEGAAPANGTAYVLPYLRVLASTELVVPVIVLLVKVSAVNLPTRVSDVVGRAKVPVLEILDITGRVRVLFVKVSAVARPTRVSVDVGSVRVPVFEMLLITGRVRVLFANTWLPDNVATELTRIVPLANVLTTALLEEPDRSPPIVTLEVATGANHTALVPL